MGNKATFGKRLTHKEWLVACCHVGGMTAWQTGKSLHLTTEAVNDYRRRVRTKLGTCDVLSTTREVDRVGDSWTRRRP